MRAGGKDYELSWSACYLCIYFCIIFVNIVLLCLFPQNDLFLHFVLMLQYNSFLIKFFVIFFNRYLFRVVSVFAFSSLIYFLKPFYFHVFILNFHVSVFVFLSVFLLPFANEWGCHKRYRL